MGNRAPLLGVSACLLGLPVRYDGSARPSAPVLDLFRHVFRLVPICPERAIGLGVPRGPIQLVETGEGLRLLDVDEPRRDHTAALRAAARRFLVEHPGLCGLVVKARSPSCALSDAAVAGAAGRTAPGLFVQVVRAVRSDLPLVDERGLESQDVLLHFMLQVLERHGGREVPTSGQQGVEGPGSDQGSLHRALLDAVACSEAGIGAAGRERLKTWLETRA
ncbi:MAG TPA: DUF523 domain-containing protein [Chromatiales bacterium]|nr:DUF523 domain-containing protein [Chromatiales bacterium]